MMRAARGRQRGVALLAMLAIFMLGASYFLVSKLYAESGIIEALRRERNAEALDRAKAALIGYIAAQAAKAGENNPGAMPCPENPADFDDTTGRQGLVGTACTTTTVGRFPWRTLGLEKLVDASGEPLWYVVGPGWGAAPGVNTVINSNSVGQLTVDGVANAAIALIIAPGPAFSVAAATGCTAIGQVRPQSGTPDWRNYLECENATSPADMTFVTSGPSASFNDQVVMITVADVMPAIEAAIASRMEREIAPQVRSAYSGGIWPATPVLPFAVPFGNPTTSPANALKGSSGTFQGLFPGSYAFAESACSCDLPNTPPCVCEVNSQGQRALEPCTVGSDPRCDPSFVTWRSTAPCGGAPCTTAASTGGVTLQTYSCAVAGSPSTLTCTMNGSTSVFNVIVGNTWMTFNLSAVAANVGMTLKRVNTPGASARATAITGIDSTFANNPIGYSIPSATLNTDGSASVVINARFPAGSGTPLAVLGSITCSFFGIPLCYRYTVSVPMSVVADNAVIHPDSTTFNWFHRNRWHELTYYATASGIAPSGARACTTGTTCLSVANVTPAGAQRGILILAGRSINGSARPSANLTDYLEFGNAGGAYTRLAPTRASGTSYADTGTPNAYVASVGSVPIGSGFRFKAVNANTGASTLNTPATGTLPLTNADASALAANTIRANAVVEVSFDGTRFSLLRRPFNDRIVVVDSN